MCAETSEPADRLLRRRRSDDERTNKILFILDRPGVCRRGHVDVVLAVSLGQAFNSTVREDRPNGTVDAVHHTLRLAERISEQDRRLFFFLIAPPPGV